MCMGDKSNQVLDMSFFFSCVSFFVFAHLWLELQLQLENAGPGAQQGFTLSL